MSGGDLRLTEFRPESELVVERREVSKPKFAIVDAHAHFGPLVLGERYRAHYDLAEEIEKLKSFGIKRIVNVETVWGEQLDQLLEHVHTAEDFILTFSSLDVTKFDQPGFEDYVRRTLEDAHKKGVRGLKFWKDIGLSKRDRQGNYMAIDDRRLQIIWAVAAELDFPVLLHIADPVAFFKPLGPTNERYEELIANPEWSFAGPGLFTFAELMDQQENLIRENPATTFIIAHGASYSENLGQVGTWLDRYPNMYIDIAARLAEFGRQPYTSREFFQRHQDRILFGIDAIAGYPYGYQPYFEFLETWNEYFDYSLSKIPGQGRWKIYGISLPDGVLEKVYHKNAEQLLGL